MLSWIMQIPDANGGIMVPHFHTVIFVIIQKPDHLEVVIHPNLCRRVSLPRFMPSEQLNHMD